MRLPIDYESSAPAVRRAARNEYVRIQNGLCAHCGEPLSGPPASKVQKAAINKRLFPETFFDWPVHLHHCHETGMSIGAVHNRCNAYLWQYCGE